MEVVDLGELDDDLALHLAQIDPNPCLQQIGQLISQVLGLGCDEPWLPVSTRPAVATGLPQRDEFLDRADGQALGHDALRDALLGGRVVDGQQSPGVAGTQHAGRDAPLHGAGEPEQSNGVGDLGP